MSPQFDSSIFIETAFGADISVLYRIHFQFKSFHGLKNFKNIWRGEI